jgi:hypothetical protein
MRMVVIAQVLFHLVDIEEIKMLDKNIFEDIEKRMQEVRSEERELTICEKDREYLYLAIIKIINDSILELLSVPNKAQTEG